MAELLVGDLCHVQDADLELADVRVAEADRLRNANSFKDAAKVLRPTRSRAVTRVGAFV